MRIRLVIASCLCAVLLAACATPSTPTTAPTLSVNATYLAFPGTTTGVVAVTATGPWTATTDQTWLQLSPSSGSGTGNLELTVDRSGLQPGSYAGSVLVSEGDQHAVISVYMRFPRVSGNITGPTLSGLATSVGTAALASPPASHVRHEVLMEVDPGYLQLRAAGGVQGGRLSAQQVTPADVRDAAGRIAGDHGMRVTGLLAPNLPWVVVSTGGLSAQQAARALRADRRVAAAQLNDIVPLSTVRSLTSGPRVQTQATPSDPYYSDQWDMSMLGMPSAWSTTTGSASVLVAVVDSGVMESHPDLSANIAYPGYDFVLDTPGATTPLSDGSYHGTHVAGIVGAVGNNGKGIAGTNWTVGILPVRVCDINGCTLSNLIRGIEYAAGMSVYNSNGTLVTPPRQANVMNLSLGAAVTTPAEEAGIEAAAAAGTTIVAAAGNDSTNCTAPPQYGMQTSPSGVSFPAAYPAAIAVGSVDYDEGAGTYAASCFSNTGPQLAVAAPGGWLFNNSKPVPPPSGFADLSKYGAFGILSTYWDAASNSATYALDEGTSMAAPHVAGVAALMDAVNPELTPVLVKLILENTTGTSTFDPALGWGLVDPSSAISFAQSNAAAQATGFIVRLEQGGTVLQQVHADPGGSFRFTGVPAGTYTVVGGNDPNHDGILGEPGEFYGTTTVTVSDTGDVTGQGLNARLQ